MKGVFIMFRQKKIDAFADLIITAFKDVTSGEYTRDQTRYFSGHGFDFKGSYHWHMSTEPEHTDFITYTVSITKKTRIVKKVHKYIRNKMIYLFATVCISDKSNVFTINPDFIILDSNKNTLPEIEPRDWTSGIFPPGVELIWSFDKTFKPDGETEADKIARIKELDRINKKLQDMNDFASKIINGTNNKNDIKALRDILQYKGKSK